jgi:hypothetical protein
VIRLLQIIQKQTSDIMTTYGVKETWLGLSHAAVFEHANKESLAQRRCHELSNELGIVEEVPALDALV